MSLQFHIPTLFVTIVTVAAFLASAMAFIAAKRQPDLMRWAKGLGLLALAYTLYAARPWVWEWGAMWTGNVAISGALAIFTAGALRLRQRQWSRGVLVGPVAIVAIGLLWLGHHFDWRFLFLATLLGGQSLQLAWALLQQRQTSLGRGESLICLGALVMGGVLVFRAWALLTGRMSLNSIADPSPLQAVTFFGVLIALLLLTLGAIVAYEELAQQAWDRSEASMRLRSEVLELLAQGHPLTGILQSIALGVEKQEPALQCSILLLDRKGRHLLEGAAPSLPDFYNQAVHGLAVSGFVREQGRTVHLNEKVITTDIANDPRWDALRNVAARAGLKACWSHPIHSSDRQLLGTFAIYLRQTRAPALHELAMIEHWAVLAGIAIERSQSAQQLSESEKQYRQLIETANEGIAVFQGGLLRFANPRFYELWGLHPTEALDTPYMSHIHPQDRESVRLTQHQRQAGIPAQQVPFRVIVPQRGERWFEENGTCIDWQGDSAILSFMSDVTERRQLQEAIERMAYHDSLTQLPNRRLLHNNLALALAACQRQGQHSALMFIDLDNFKPLNDQHGHEIGDLLLIEVASRLLQGVRQGDTVARFGGDEFVVLAVNLDADPALARAHADTVANKLRNSLAQTYVLRRNLPSPTLTGTIEHHCQASIGVVLFNGEVPDPETVIKAGDLAMYRAKQAGRNTVCLTELKDVPPERVSPLTPA